MKKINLGCNKYKLDGFINIDINKKYKPDLVANVMKLPYKNNEIDEIYAGHILEHVPFNEDPLKEWKRVLKPGGKITIVVPNIYQALILLDNGEISQGELQEIVMGSQKNDKEIHYRVYTVPIIYSEISKYFKKPKGLSVEDCPYLVSKVSWQIIVTAKK